MKSDLNLTPSSTQELLFHNARRHFLVICILFISAFGIRLYHINRPPLDYAPIRQYQDATNARASYFATLNDISADRKEIAALNAERMGFALEPRIMESLAVFGYRISGGEKLWIPRVLSALFWTIGGIFVFLTARKITTVRAALFSAAFYLFLPCSISASRSFQPDPMMIMLLMISLFMIVWNYESPSKSRLIAASGISALAIFVKPYCIFLIFGAALSLLIKRHGIKKTVLNVDFILFALISVLPTFVYYGYTSLVQKDAQAHIQASFLPSLLLRSYFWKDWLTMIGKVTGYVPFVGALIGLFMSRGLLRTVLTGLWIGYVFFGLVFTYHIHTHEYYQLQFIPVVALSLIPAAAAIRRKLSTFFLSRKGTVILSVAGIVLISGIGYFVHSVDLKGYKNFIKPVGAFIGVNPDFYKFITADFNEEVRAAREIGEIVGHSANTVFLTSDYGRSLSYHGELSGLPWPISTSMRDRKEMGTPIPDKEELFNPRYLMIRTYKSNLFKGKKVYEEYIRYTPDYFIITDYKEFDMQPDLKQFLYKNFPVKAKSDRYLIFDMSKMSGPDK